MASCISSNAQSMRFGVFTTKICYLFLEILRERYFEPGRDRDGKLITRERILGNELSAFAPIR